MTALILPIGLRVPVNSDAAAIYTGVGDFTGRRQALGIGVLPGIAITLDVHRRAETG
ncbi:hypothetical protein [Sphingobium sp. RAC03]|uniref:hypothetical protein n=1 Tax=Sphingobium sp. RAC03 TaxID=1843368 RepID=UPI0014959B3D|nr:hypothetical protein [Sphingobium sp. RAC03]